MRKPLVTSPRVLSGKPCTHAQLDLSFSDQAALWLRPLVGSVNHGMVGIAGGGKVLARRPTQLRRIGGQMYRLVTNGAGRMLQRQQTPKHKQQQQTFQTLRPVIRKVCNLLCVPR